MRSCATFARAKENLGRASERERKEQAADTLSEQLMFQIVLINEKAVSVRSTRGLTQVKMSDTPTH